MATKPAGKQPVDGLAIGDLARMTGVTSSTLRMWESRYGFPRAYRTISGHRRYDPALVEQVEGVLRRKAEGMTIQAAVREVTEWVGRPVGSVFAHLQRRHTSLYTHRLRKRMLTALTHAIEDECCARAQRPWLFATFQRDEFYRQSERRWQDFAATAAGAWVFADFAEHAPDRSPAEVALPPGAILNREWTLVCLAGDLSACVSAWELPGQKHVPDSLRAFETVWSVDPTVVRDAAHVCVRTIQDLGLPADGISQALDGPGYLAPGDVGRATAVFNRIVAYMDRSAQ